MKVEKIALNLSRVGKHGTGMWNYSKNIADMLHESGFLDSIICSKDHVEYFSNRYKDPKVDIIITPEIVSNTMKVSKFRPLIWLSYSYFLGCKLVLSKKKKDVALLSTTHHSIPFFKNQFITIHDLRPAFYPDSKLQEIYFSHYLPRKVKELRGVFTVSETVKNEIEEHMGVARSDIQVVYNSVDPSLRPDGTDNSEQATIKNTFLMVGASWKHKNAHSFLKNFLTYHKDNYSAVIVCGQTDYFDELKSLVATLGLENNVTFKHHISEQELSSLYKTSFALVYPSLSEGFGIPPIEAMSLSLPVIVSDIPVFKEILGEAAVYVDPNVRESWEHAVDTLKVSRENVIDTGLQRVNLYSYDRCKDMLMLALKNINEKSR
ncbi:glycosyltransferase family 4 protein [Pectobacterium atrosepticum]|uniref:glycosyltransferase family 4 protein n=1 Tax=Pectobacterium atrosepticum TaxID=29471 RepID=UPI0004E83D07|nr:glycosyltransferase family 1 protein [Pectobacterium atrosepticum]GKV86610.1 glycosyl transferase [Pectobacterium carotovorum subsp. carotovorum]AIK13309.1 putative glycosyl transferase [Pectobacterium atrosepticum]ATY90213.1 glycosyltransferase family 1 protein [Pectobacterium atrosepticum]MBL0894912.1 glycosyltransferase family 4 protein [Pectobacterium atrosepticum]MCA6976963.1 glycosyltransferase family 4 protein [Pectobacterium atrosepticum]